MRLVNETTNEYLEKLKEEAIRSYKWWAKEYFSSSLKTAIFLVVCAILFLIGISVCLYSGVKNILPLVFFVIFTMIIGVFGILEIKDTVNNYRAYKTPLTDEKLKEICNNDAMVKWFIEDLDTYAKLEKSNIIGYSYEENNVVFECANNEEIIEEIKIDATINKQKDIKNTALTLTNDGFVFEMPYFIKC